MIHDGAAHTYTNTDIIRRKLGVLADDDPRLTDARNPTTHTHALADIIGLTFLLDDLDRRLTEWERTKLLDYLVVDNQGRAVVTEGGAPIWAIGTA